jgi:hypothetical protein
MDQPLTSHIFFRKFGGLAALAIGSLSLLTPFDAKAASYNACQTGGSQNPFNINFTAIANKDQITCQDKLFIVGDPKDLVASNDYFENTQGGFLSFKWSKLPPSDLFYTNDVFKLLTAFQPDVIGPKGGSFRYTLSTTSPQFNLLTADLDSVAYHNAPTDTTVTKDIYVIPDFQDASDPDSLDITQLSLLLSLTSTNGSSNIPTLLTGAPTQILVVDTWSIADGDTLTNFENSFTQSYSGAPPDETPVPGPLPLIGAGAAYSFSRRLRIRIRNARQA